MAPDDRALLLAWRGGDNRAGQTLVERHRPAVLRSFLNKVGTTAEAETLAQRTFATALADRVRLLDGVAVHTWLLAVARHVLLEWRDDTARRRRFTGPPGDASVADLGLGPTPAPAPNDGARRMLEALRRLPLESQLVLEHAYIEELAPRELADVLGCLDVVARRHLQVAQPTLRKALGDASPKEIEAWGHQIREAWG
jgi:RNA polymerase sigma factor (sigma-70 family)